MVFAYLEDLKFFNYKILDQNFDCLVLNVLMVMWNAACGRPTTNSIFGDAFTCHRIICASPAECVA